MVELMGTTSERTSIYRDAETVSAEEYREHEEARYFLSDGIQSDGIRIYELAFPDRSDPTPSCLGRRHVHVMLYTKRRAGTKAFKSLVSEVQNMEPCADSNAGYRLANSRSVYWKGFGPVL